MKISYDEIDSVENLKVGKNINFTFFHTVWFIHEWKDLRKDV
jgi:hypothetical protein